MILYLQQSFTVITLIFSRKIPAKTNYIENKKTLIYLI